MKLRCESNEKIDTVLGWIPEVAPDCPDCAELMELEGEEQDDQHWACECGSQLEIQFRHLFRNKVTNTIHHEQKIQITGSTISREDGKTFYLNFGSTDNDVIVCNGHHQIIAEYHTFGALSIAKIFIAQYEVTK